MFRKFVKSPFINLMSGLILFLTAGYETMVTIDEFELGAHHGVMAFGVIQRLKALPDLMESLKSIHFSIESR